MGEYVQATYIAVGLLVPFLALLRWLHPWPTTQDLALGFLLGMSGTALVLLVRGLGPWPEGGIPGAFLTAGALEEAVKLLLGGLLLRRLGGEIKLGPAEGALTLAFLGAGFEAVEDFQYLIGGVGQGLPLGEVVAARALPMHLALGLAVGGYLARGLAGRPLWLAWAWLLAAGLHGGFNAVAGHAPFPWAAGYSALVLGWALSCFLREGRRSPWGLGARLRGMDPWKAGVAVQGIGWEGWGYLAKGEGSPVGWVLALGLAILYPILVLALGLFLQLVGGG